MSHPVEQALPEIERCYCYIEAEIEYKRTATVSNLISDSSSRNRSSLSVATECCTQVEMEVTDCLFQQNYGGKD